MGEEVKKVKKRILVVDDEEEIRFLLETKFYKLGYSVEIAATGAQAMQKVNAHPPFDLVVCDLKMPKMNGIEFFKQLVEKSPNSKFLMITGFPEKEKLLAAMKTGIINIMLKPVKHSEIVAKINQLIGEA